MRDGCVDVFAKVTCSSSFHEGGCGNAQWGDGASAVLTAAAKGQVPVPASESRPMISKFHTPAYFFSLTVTVRKVVFLPFDAFPITVPLFGSFLFYFFHFFMVLIILRCGLLDGGN